MQMNGEILLDLEQLLCGDRVTCEEGEVNIARLAGLTPSL